MSSTDLRTRPGEDKDKLPEVLSDTALSNSFLGNLVEVCIVTADYRRTMEGLVRLGIGPWRIYTFDGATVTEKTFRGAPADFAIKVCFAECANVTFEIMQPLRGPTIFEEFLKTHGAGIHHLAFDCADIPWTDRLSAFEDRGFPVMQSGLFGRTPFAFFGTDGATMTTFETYFVPKGYWQEPEEWFPGPPPRHRQ